MNMIFRLLSVIIRQKRRKRLSIWDTSRTPFRVLPTDLDLLGHMNNSKYLSLMDLGRMDLMIRAGYARKMQRLGWYPVVASQTISYRRSLNPWMKFDLHSKILGFSETGIYMEQTFCKGKDVYAQAIVRARFLKKKGGTVSYAELLDVLDETPDGRLVPDWVEEWGLRSKQIEKTFIK